MNDLLRGQLIDSLVNGWGNYVVRFRALDPQEQLQFLQQQGYARLADLLAHVSAWWNAGAEGIRQALADPAFQSPPYDVDGFNADAVQAAAGFSENEVIERFDAALQAMLDLVRNLPDHAYAQDGIARRLEMEIIGHLSEHNLPG